MSRDYNQGVAGRTYLRKGDWNAFCQRCGKKYKASQLTQEWTQLWVCHSCYEDRNAQEFVRGIIDQQAVPWSASEAPDNFILNAAITGLTTAPFAPGSEVVWDFSNTLSVQVSGGTLSSAADQLAVMNGANLCAVMNSGGGAELKNAPAPAWEILQFTTATLTAPATYALTGLLRARYGTENAMNLGTIAAGSPFVFIGQASASNDLWIKGNLGWLMLPFSPVYIAGSSNSNGDRSFSWIRRSRIPGIWEDPWSGRNGLNFLAPIDEPEERYEVDILNASGTPIRTLRAWGTTTAVYPLANQIADFGASQASYTITVYQTDPTLGRGQGRTATV